MGYRNGKDCLPANLLKQLQDYIQGEIIYVPKRGQKRAGWGENNGTRMIIAQRNQTIYEQYQGGLTMHELVRAHHLSEDSIRKIISKTNVEMFAIT